MGQGSQGGGRGSQEWLFLFSLGLFWPPVVPLAPLGFYERLCSFPKAAKKSEIFILALARPNLGKGTNEKVPYGHFLFVSLLRTGPGWDP